FLSKNAKDAEALDSLLKAQKHETEAFRLSGGEEYGDYLYMTHRNLFVAQMKLKKYEEAIETIEERIKLWPKNAKKHLEAAADLAVIHQRDPSEKNVKRIHAFFQRALQENM